MPLITSKNLSIPDKTFTFLDGSKRTVVFLDSLIIGRAELKKQLPVS